MTVSRATLAARAEQRRNTQRLARARSRNLELLGLIAASILAGTGLWLVYAAKAQTLAEQQQNTLNLNELTGPAQLIPRLGILSNSADQEFAANRIYDWKRHGHAFENDGAIARMRVTEDGIAHTRGLNEFPQRLRDARERRESREHAQEARRNWFERTWRRWRTPAAERELSIPLLTPAQFAQLKPSLVVRRAADFRKQFFLWTALFLLGFFAVHLFWRWRGFAGDNLLLPIMLALAGLGLMLMVSMRDPLRDTLMFTDFAQGVLAGCVALAVLALPDYERSFGRLSYVPLLVSFLLAIALGLFGTGPGGSDAKVNLFFFQPVEVIRILLVFFLAGYFARNWDALRQLRQEHGRLATISQRFKIPRLEYLLPVAAGVAVSLALFFWLSDLGPALVIGCLFLVLYGVARNGAWLAAAGGLVIVLGFALGHAAGYPHTVTERVNMWLSPWDNHVRGGDQLADSLWSLATGGAAGTGLGLGDPQLMPAAHTDLIVSALGEELGLLGVLAVYALYGALIYRCLRIARHAPGAYSFFLVTGLALILALQILLISGGLLGLIPLSGVVSPFLSYGRTSMVANFALFAIVLAVSSRSSGERNQDQNFGRASGWLAVALCVAGAILVGRFAYVQVVKGDDIVARGALVTQADGVRRYQYNPRLLEIARQLPKGTIYDRNGLPLAASDSSVLEKHSADYERLGIALDHAAAQPNGRRYPLGAPLFYLLGDARSRLKQGASNTAFQEKASRVRLQGFDDVAEVEESRDPETGQITSRARRDYRALVPLLRHRYEPDNPAVKAIRERPRDVRMSIDAALQLRASEILKNHLIKLQKQKGAIVVLDPASGDLLAAVSYPWPSPEQFASLSSSAEAPLPDQDLLDRARFGLYPPGSSFKIVTAIAALRKDPSLAAKHYDCVRLPDGRVGNVVWKRAIRDDITDRQPHGSVDMARGVAVSCNAYFAQLGSDSVGSKALYETASALGIAVAQPNTAEKLQQYLPQASYGQGQVVASPFQMARVAAAIANGGKVLQGRWVIDETNVRVRAPDSLLPPELAKRIAGFMRSVVTTGTGRVLSKSPIPIAGKTGTAELGKAPSHAWFIGFAPYGAPPEKQIAFAVLVENGQYGGTAAAPIAGDLVAAARELGII